MIRSAAPMLALVVLPFVCVTVASRAPAAEPEPWDQAAVTAIAEKLAVSVKGVRKRARKAPPDSVVGSGQANSRFRFMDRLRVIERETAALASALADGQGHGETLPIFERVDRERALAAEEARRMFFPQDILDTLIAARGMVDELRAYYTGEEPPPSGLHGPTKE